MTQVTKKAALEYLLLSLFTVDEFRRLLRHGAQGDELDSSLPDEPRSPAEFVHVAVEMMARRGLLDVDLFGRLTEARPARIDDIRHVQALFADINTVARPGSTVRCLRCGQRAQGADITPHGERAAYYCLPCREILLASPILPNGYNLRRTIGAGPTGAVYLARHQALRVDRAIKLILPAFVMNERTRRQFIREAAVQAALNHPRIVQVYEFQEVKPGYFCMIMEYFESTNAADLLAAHRPTRRLEARSAVTIVAQALDGLHHAHEQGVVHRDVSDTNILVGGTFPNFVVKLADFGLAKMYELSDVSRITQTGETSGTLDFMSPEQILDYRHVGPSSDIYSMGVVLYRLLSGALPRETPEGVMSLTTMLERPITPLIARVEVPEALARAVERALSEQPEQRYESADAMRRAILASLPD